MTLRKIIGPRGEVQFKYFNSYMGAELNDIDVLVCDEAHRIRETSNNRFTKREVRSSVPQIKELLQVAKVGVYFIDDRQIVRPNQIGSADYIRNQALKLGCEVSDYTLEAHSAAMGPRRSSTGSTTRLKSSKLRMCCGRGMKDLTSESWVVRKNWKTRFLRKRQKTQRRA